MINTKKRREGFLGQKMVIIPDKIKDKIRDNNLINSLYTTDIGYYPHAKNHFREREEGADEYIFIYCVEGKGWINTQSVKYELIPNSYFIIPPHEAHTYGTQPDDPWSIYWLHFTGSKAELLYNRFLDNNSNSDNKPEVVTLPYSEQRTKHFKNLISILESGYRLQHIEFINLSLWQLLSSFIYNNLYEQKNRQDFKKDSIDRAIEYMQDHIDQSITVEELSDYLNYSASYLYSIFKEHTGYSPIQYFNHLKIQRASQYLSFTNFSIKEISFELGFNDPFYFSRLFKKMMSISPSEYRKHYKH